MSSGASGWARVEPRPTGSLHLSDEGHAYEGRGGFRTVQLNAAGWTAVLSPGVVIGGLAAGLAFGAEWAAAGVVGGMAAAYAAARLADEVRDRRRTSYIPVAVPAEAEARLRAAGIPTRGRAETDVRGRRVKYVAVRARDDEHAAALVGLPHDSRRARRRWKFALWAAARFERRR